MFTNLWKLVVVSMCLALAAVPALADPVGGPKSTETNVKSFDTDYYFVSLVGGEDTRIRLVGNTTTCLELRVVDENGNLVASDTLGLGDKRTVRVTPRWTGKFKVMVTNIDRASNHYVMVID